MVVLVFNPQSDRLFDTLGRWDHDIQLAARQAYAKLLVAARTDVGGLRVSREALNAFIAQRNFSHYLETRCPFHKFAASQAAARLYGLGGYNARSNRLGRELNQARPCRC